jgi:hypothetical protein
MRKAFLFLLINLLLIASSSAQELEYGSRRFVGANIILGPSAAGLPSELRFRESIANGANYIGFKAPTTLGSNIVFVLPSSDATGVLKSNGSLSLSFGTAAVGDGGTGATTLTGLLQGNGTGAFTAITNSTTVGQVLRVTGANSYGWGALDLADSDAVTGTLPSGNGGTANAFFAVSGPATSTKTFTFPNASATVLTTNAAVTPAQGGTGQVTYTKGDILIASDASTLTKLGVGTNDHVLTADSTQATGVKWAAVSASAGVAVQNVDVTATTVSNTAAETSVYGYSVPGGTLSTNHALRLTLIGTMLNNTGSLQAVTIKLYYGGNLILNSTGMDAATSSNGRSITAQFFLSALNATNAQVAQGRVMLSGASGNSTTMLGEGTVVNGTNTSIAIDSTSSQTLEVKVTLGSASASLTYTLHVAYLEKL